MKKTWVIIGVMCVALMCMGAQCNGGGGNCDGGNGGDDGGEDTTVVTPVPGAILLGGLGTLVVGWLRGKKKI